MNLTDTHIHLHFPQYDPDRSEMIERAIRGGISSFLNIGTDLENSRKAIAIADEYPQVYAAVGYHPHEAKHAHDAELAELEKLLKHPKVQEKILRTFLSWYDQYRKPIIIHCRDAYDDLLRILREHTRLPYRGTLHCYSSDAKTMKEYLDLGFHIAFGGALTYKKNDVLREACTLCPKDRLLLETDGPYLPPQSKRGTRNEPLYMVETAECAAKLHGMTVEEIAELTTANAKRLFGLC